MNDAMALLAQLRARGFKVSVTHARLTASHAARVLQFDVLNRPVMIEQLALPIHALEAIGRVPGPFGGRTVVAATAPDGTTYAGIATCSPLDEFVKHVGMMKACGRLYSQLVYAGQLDDPRVAARRT